MERIEISYRGYVIVAGMLKGVPTARVLLGQAMATREQFTGGTPEKAADAARAWVDRINSEKARQRREPNVGTVEDYERYFSYHPLAEHHRAMLTAHARAPDRTMTAAELAAAAGWGDYNPANAHYGLLGDAIAQFLELSLPKRASGSPIGTSAIAASADPDWKPVDGYFRWQMHPELAEALRRLNIV